MTHMRVSAVFTATIPHLLDEVELNSTRVLTKRQIKYKRAVISLA